MQILLCSNQKRKNTPKDVSLVLNKGMDHDAEGTFFGALAQASKPPNEFFFVRVRKKRRSTCGQVTETTKINETAVRNNYE